MEELVMARHRYLQAFNRPPTQLFLSPEAYVKMWDWARHRIPGARSLVGARLYNLNVHLVPTLESGFYVA